MAKLGTHLALKKLLSEAEYELLWLRSGYSKQARARLKGRLEKDELSLNKMEEILENCGFTVIQEKQWQTPKL